MKSYGDGTELPGSPAQQPANSFPFYPGAEAASPPLKACVFDNLDDQIGIAKGIPETSRRASNSECRPATLANPDGHRDAMPRCRCRSGRSPPSAAFVDAVGHRALVRAGRADILSAAAAVPRATIVRRGTLGPPVAIAGAAGRSKS